MLAVNPVIVSGQGPPVAHPSVVEVIFGIVGFSDIPHTIPLVVTVSPPSETIVPPLVAEVWVIFVTGDVVTVGTLITLVTVTVAEADPAGCQLQLCLKDL